MTRLDDRRHIIRDIVQSVLIDVEMSQIPRLGRFPHDVGPFADRAQRQQVFHSSIHVHEDTEC